MTKLKPKGIRERKEQLFILAAPVTQHSWKEDMREIHWDALGVNVDRQLRIEFQRKHGRIVTFISWLKCFYEIERLSGVSERCKL